MCRSRDSDHVTAWSIVPLVIRRPIARALLGVAAGALVLLANAASTPAAPPPPDPCAELRAAAEREAGSMRAEGYVFRMQSAGCASPPYHLLPKP